METIVKVSPKGQVVIPAKLRRKHQMEPGATVRIVEYGDMICLVPVGSEAVEEAWGALPSNPSLADELLKERRKDFTDG